MALRSLLAAVLLAIASPALPQTDTAVPADLIARAKFPTDSAEQIDALAYINRYVNEHIEGMSDREHYGIDELWVMFPEDGKGDCEDYALTKLGILSNAGFPIISNTKIVGVIARYKGQSDGHAVLAVRLPSGAVMYMDNLNAEPMTRPELEARGYVFFDWKA